MRPKEHATFSTMAAIIALPWLKKDIWLPFASSIFIDVDHYLWHVVAYRTLSLRAAIRYFGQADPPQLTEARLLHHPLVLGTLLFFALRLRSRTLGLILAGLLFHVSLDVIHVTQTSNLKRSLSKQASNTCHECHQQFDELQLHTTYLTPNLLDRYNPQHFIMLCPTCHERAHASWGPAQIW
ncbi:MAG: hypothetical protein PVS3B3_36300 [Ktedonobacteraceae bacterium]